MPAPELGGGRANLLLAGFSGTGKSSAGRIAAELLRMPFFDLDEIAERRSGQSLPELFHSCGEASFRELEVALLQDATQLSGAVIATGGGAVLHPEFAVLAKTGVAVVLAASPEEIQSRLAGDAPRPLLASAAAARIRELLAERAPAYARAGVELATAGLEIPEVGALIADRYRSEQGSRSHPIVVPGPDGDYPVLVGSGELVNLDQLLRDRLPRSGRVLVISDGAVAGSAGARLEAILASAGRNLVALTVPAGEFAKELSAVSQLWDEFQSLALDRGDVVVAVGGGAALDAIGFAAATWGRGVPWVTVPTTVLAMVDASIGGKVAIDRGSAKNAVGAFHHPRLVVCDPQLLATLPPQVARDGLAEVVKKAVLASPLLLDFLAQPAPPGMQLPQHLSWLIEQAVRIKAAYVGADPRDQGVRQSLNLGHTYAHGLEAASDYRVSHGRAVAVGLVAASRFGLELGISPSELPPKLEFALDRLGFAEPLPPLDRARVRAALQLDKKRRGGDASFVVPARGGAALVSGIELELALAPLWGLLPEADGGTPERAAAGSRHQVAG